MADKKLDIIINFIKKISGLEDSKESIEAFGESVETAGKKGKKSFKDLNKRIKTFNKSIKTGTKNVLAWGKKLSVATTGAAAGIGALAVNSAKFNITVARAQTMTDKLGFKEMRAGALKLAQDIGIAKNEISDGLYQALSASVPEENLFSFVSTAAKIAVTDGSDVATAVDGLSTVLNAFKLDASKTDQVADAMFKTVANGKTTFAELAHSMAAAAPTAAALGVKYDQIMAATASLTKQGIPTSTALRQINAMMLGLNRSLGDGWQKIRTFQEAIEEAARRGGYSASKLEKAFGRENVSGVLALVGQNAQRAKLDLDEMAKAAGTLEEKYKQVDQYKHWDKAWEAAKTILIQIGDVLDKNIKDKVIEITEKIKSWNNNQEFWDRLSDKIGEIREIIEGLWDSIQDGRGKEVFSALGGLLVAYLKKGGEEATEYIKVAAPKIGELIGRAAAAVISGPVDRAQAINELYQENKISYMEAASAHMWFPNKFGQAIDDPRTVEIEEMIQLKARYRKMGSIVADSLKEGAAEADEEIRDYKAKLKELSGVNKETSDAVQKASDTFGQSLADYSILIRDENGKITQALDAAGNDVTETAQEYSDILQEAAENTSEAGQAIADAGQDMADAADTVAQSAETAQEQIYEAGEKTGKDIDNSAQIVTTATQAAAGTIATSMTDLTQSVTRMGTSVQTSMTNTQNTLNSAIKLIESMNRQNALRMSALEQSLETTNSNLRTVASRQKTRI